MFLERCSGVLLHPTSLPGGQGIGSLGDTAHRFVDWLADAGQSLWQMCPLGPTGYGNSPYQCFSAFAGNPLIVDLERLQRAGWLTEKDLEAPAPFNPSRVDYARAISFVWSRLERAHARFKERASPADRERLERFCQQEAGWLDDYALFMAIKGRYAQRSWEHWDEALRLREPAAMDRARTELAGQIDLQRFVQHTFASQWQELRDHAHAKGIRIVGDLPIYVAYDSADVWAHRDLFLLDERGRPRVVAGVPPDAFSATGQLWGNPIYDWPKHRETGFRWWTDVVRAKLASYDAMRVDHFRGFAGYWAVPYGEPTAERGSWQPGPGAALFEALTRAIGPLPIIAEDLGVITPDVIELRQRFSLPGMKVLQFAWDSEGENEYRPHTYETYCVAYTGTHDNDTTRGWHATLRAKVRAYCEEYLGVRPETAAWDLLRAAWASPALVAIAPLQDVLELGSEARFNVPGVPVGNWEWRFEAPLLSPERAARLKRLGDVYARAADVLGKPKARFELGGAARTA